ncbi:hypothetical protein [Niallia taxi]|uniref:Uncharacterized protein n=1 Tax=Niallia taxi TaxID=2499688 RepID=A0A3S2TRX6_9BACI|nr:hypothetical protein [Niallia taxi]RVT58271.1 hypothetical protein EM808_22405 [Niallia taxi]
MTVYVYQTFSLKQDKFKEGLENLRELKKFSNENYSHKVEILTPISGNDHTYALMTEYEGLAEMELQSKKMTDDEDYQKLIGEFFLQNIEQGSMHTQIYRAMVERKEKKNKDKEAE